VLLHQQDRHSGGGRVLKRCVQAVNDLRGEPQRQLISDQDPRPSGQGPGHDQDLLLSPGKQPCPPREEGRQFGEQGNRCVDAATPEAEVAGCGQ
jgi:hypothetical protein